jgi:uncharacterized protein (TIGR03435 family)
MANRSFLHPSCITLKGPGRAALRLLPLTFATAVLIAQQTPVPLKFEVAAIHRSQPGESGSIRPMPNGTGYLVHNMTAKMMMATVYRIPARQIIGGPDWFDTERFDLEAKADHMYSLDDLHTMFKNLLADRFALKFHLQIKEGPVYDLLTDKSGVKMKPAGSVSDLGIPIMPSGPGEFIGTKVPIPYLCFFLGLVVRNDPRPVIDKTGLTQVYDFKLEYAPEPPPEASAENLPPELQNRPTIFEALREQLGLRLEPAKGPVDFYVIDRLNLPSPN